MYLKKQRKLKAKSITKSNKVIE